MARLLRASSGWRRAWLAVWLQGRRRKRGGAGAGPYVPPPDVPAPVIVNASPDWGRSQNGWADVGLDWTFAAGNLPPGEFEIWWKREAVDQNFSLVASVPGASREYWQTYATSEQVFAYYKLRYRNGSLVGPFSDEYTVDI